MAMQVASKSDTFWGLEEEVSLNIKKEVGKSQENHETQKIPEPLFDSLDHCLRTFFFTILLKSCPDPRTATYLKKTNIFEGSKSNSKKFLLFILRLLELTLTEIYNILRSNSSGTKQKKRRHWLRAPRSSDDN